MGIFGKTVRVESIKVLPNRVLSITWNDGRKNKIDLNGWIATGGEILASLKEERSFATAQIEDFGSTVEWLNNEDIAIDAVHLRLLADQQLPVHAKELVRWQKRTGLSNREAADFFGVAVSTWHNYKAGHTVPSTVQILCRATDRDPVLLQAHYKPRKAGRPVSSKSVAR